MQRDQSHITLFRPLVQAYGHFPAMVLDCLRNRIAVHLAAQVDDERFFRNVDGLVFVKASGRFICNWIMCDRTTATKALIKLGKNGVLQQRFLTGKNQGAWYAFTAQFISNYQRFFDGSVKQYLLAQHQDFMAIPVADISATPVVDISATGVAGISATGGRDVDHAGCDNITSGCDEITSGCDIITPSPIYNTNNTNNHLNGENGGGVHVFDFLEERDEPFGEAIALTLKSYPGEDAVQLMMDQMDWKSCRRATRKQLKKLATDFGFDIYAAGVVMAAAEQNLGNPLSFLRAVCKRLADQRADNERRRRLQHRPPAPPAPVDQSGKSVSEILGGESSDPATWQKHLKQ